MIAQIQPATAPFSALTTERLLRSIAHYERKAAELDNPTGPRETTLRRTYETLVDDRRRLLAALEDGHPELWTDYPLSKL